MGIFYNILNDGEGTETIFNGIVHGKEIIQIRNEMYSFGKNFTPYKYHIFNKSQCTEYNVTAEDIITIAALDIRAANINPIMAIAIIESEYLQFNLTEAWQAHVEDHIAKINSFTDRCSAISWIKNIVK